MYPAAAVRCSKLSRKSRAPGARERLGDALEDRPAVGVAHAEHMGDRGRDELGIGHGGEADEVHRPLDRGQRGDLERKPALAGAARPGDRDEPDVGALQQRQGGGQVLAAADEAMVERGERRAAERAQGSEPLLQTGGDELEELLGAGDVLQPVAPERAERDRGIGVADEVTGRPRDHDLTAVGGGTDPGGDDDVHPDVAFVAEIGLARVDPDP